MKKCVLYDRNCIKCNECDLCDIDPNKICDNCCECIDLNEDYYKEILIDDILDNDETHAFEDEWKEDD
ncbi:MAG: hypothetical protein ACOYJC_03730 [Christensenellales bacterium]